MDWCLEPEVVAKFGFECPICASIIRNAHSTGCGHMFCKDCLIRHRTTDRRCPTCRSNASHPYYIMPLPTVDRMIATLAARCTNEGCDWKGAYGDIDAHLARCEHQTVPCDDCKTRVLRRDLPAHAPECLCRKVPCEKCGATVNLHLQASHDNVCPEVTMSCAFCATRVLRKHLDGHQLTECPVECKACGKPTTRVVLEIHLANECPQECFACHNVLLGERGARTHVCPKLRRPCSYARIGCKTMIDGSTTLKHLQDAAVYHEGLFLEATVYHKGLFLEANAPTPVGITTGNLLTACIRERPESLHNLLMNNNIVDLNACDKHGNAPLRVALEAKCIESVRTLLQWGADPNYMGGNARDSINFAVRTGDEDIVRLMIANGANVYNRSRKGKGYAMFTRNPRILTLIATLAAGPMAKV